MSLILNGRILLPYRLRSHLITLPPLLGQRALLRQASMMKKRKAVWSLAVEVLTLLGLDQIYEGDDAANSMKMTIVAI